MSLTRFDNIVFDMDGVLIESEFLQVEAEKFVCAKYGIVVPDHEWMTFKGRTNRSIFDYLVTTYAKKPVSVDELIAEKRAYVKRNISNVKMIPGALTFLLFLRDYRPRKKIALTTSTGREIQNVIFDRFHLHGYFDQTITGDDVTNGKPHPEPYRVTAERMGAQAEACVVIEDSDNGIKSAKAAGCFVVGITTSFSREVLLAAGADIIVDSYKELRKLFR